MSNAFLRSKTSKLVLGSLAAGILGTGIGLQGPTAASANTVTTVKTAVPTLEYVKLKYRLSDSQWRNVIKASNWAKGRKQTYIRMRESGNNYTINTGNGYYGAWQFDYGSWLGNGGGKFSKTANKAPKWAQDYVAWSYWKRAGWGPWGG